MERILGRNYEDVDKIMRTTNRNYQQRTGNIFKV